MNDHHVHSNFSGDCKTKMEDMVTSAIDKRLDSICITDHLDIDYMDSSCPKEMFLFDPKLYLNEIDNLKNIYQSKIKLYSGIEIGIQPHLCSTLDSLFPINQFEFKILSLHTSKKNDLHNGDFFKEKSSKAAYIDFFEDLYYSIKNYSNYNVIGHINLIDRYSNYILEKVDFNCYSDLIENILKEIISNGKGLEINTSSFRYNMKDTLPSKNILKLYKDLGGEIIVFGSDSHTTSALGGNYNESIESLKSLNYKYISYYNKGSFSFKKI